MLAEHDGHKLQALKRVQRCTSGRTYCRISGAWLKGECVRNHGSVGLRYNMQWGSTSLSLGFRVSFCCVMQAIFGVAVVDQA